MATRKSLPKGQGKAKIRIRQRIKNGGKKISVKKSSALLINRKKQKELADPLAIPIPASYLSYDTCKHIIVLRKTQYKLWSWAIVLAFLLLFAVTAIELMLDFHILSPASKQYAEVLSHASLLAIFIIGMELASSFALAKNKMIFLRNNWLAILAIIPAGIFARAGAGVFEFFEAISSFRFFQLAGKLGEVSSLIPNLNLPQITFLQAPALAIGQFADSAKSALLKIVK